MTENQNTNPDYYHCPHCGAEVPNEGQKVYIHKTFCRDGDDDDNFVRSSLLQRSMSECTFELLQTKLEAPPWGVRVFDAPDGGLTIRYKVRTLVWPFTGLYMGAIGILQHLLTTLDMDVIIITIFVLTSIHYVFTLIYCLVTRWDLTIGHGHGVFKSGLGPLARVTYFEYNGNSTVTARRLREFGRNLLTIVQVMPDLCMTLRTMLLSLFAGHVTQTRLADLDGIVLTTDGKPYCFGRTVPNENALRYMAACLLREIADYGVNENQTM